MSGNGREECDLRIVAQMVQFERPIEVREKTEAEARRHVSGKRPMYPPKSKAPCSIDQRRGTSRDFGWSESITGTSRELEQAGIQPRNEK